MAQSYTDQLSDNVKRSLDFKTRNGEWIAKAPIGYSNIKDERTGKSTIIPDKNNAHFIRKFFIEYSTGAYSMAELSQIFQEMGLRSRKGYKIEPQLLHTLIQNPFYYGVMRVKNVLYAHKYEPLISKNIFDKCQQVRLGRSRQKTVKKTKYPYLFRGFFKCALTGKQVTCDLKKNKYVYMISTNPHNLSKKTYVKQEKVIAHIEKKLRAIRISNEEFLTLKEYVIQSLPSERQSEEQIISTLSDERVDI